jgi:two-component system sensor histidine kinase DegS
MRTFIYQLRPIMMKEKEIGQWVLDLCRQFQEATGIPVEAQVGAPAEEELSPAISIALFRIIQETLANIYKHAQASRATLSLDFGPTGARLVIEDNGRGFDVEARPVRAIQQGHGLANIEERVRELGATLELESAPGAGTRLEAVFPYSR